MQTDKLGKINISTSILGAGVTTKHSKTTLKYKGDLLLKWKTTKPLLRILRFEGRGGTGGGGILGATETKIMYKPSQLICYKYS